MDLACGGGRHSRHLLGLGYQVVAVDKDTSHVQDLGPKATVITLDMEDGNPVFSKTGPLSGRTFDGIVVTNYLYRPHLADLIAALAPGGVLIYETFARGNERFNRPRNPDHLLKSGELLQLIAGTLQIVAYEHGVVENDDLPGVKQRLCAVNDLGASDRDDGEPAPHPL